MEIKTGEPTTEGRYLAFVADDITKIYARPIVLMWNKGWWYYPTSSVRYSPKVYGFFGPLPVGLLAEMFEHVIEVPIASSEAWEARKDWDGNAVHDEEMYNVYQQHVPFGAGFVEDASTLPDEAMEYDL